MVADSSLPNMTSARSMVRLPAHDSAAEIDIFSLFAMIWRQKYLVVLVTLIGFIGFWFLTGFIQSRYDATSVVLLSIPSGFETNKGGADLSEAIEIIRSRAMGQHMVETLELLDDAEFASSVDNTSAGFKSLSVEGQSDQAALYSEVRFDSTVSRFLSHLSVRELAGAPALQINFTSVSPYKAALIANRVAESFIAQRLEGVSVVHEQQKMALDAQLSKLRKEIQAHNTRIEAHKKEHALVQGMLGMSPAQQAEQVDERLRAAQAEVLDIEARLKHIRSLRLEGLSVENLPDAVQSDDLDAIKAETIKLEQQIAELSGRYGAKHPLMIQARDEMQVLQGKVAQEVKGVIRNLEDELGFAQAREKSLLEQLQVLSTSGLGDYDALNALQEMEYELDLKRGAYEALVKQYQVEDVQDETASYRVLSRAVPSFKPVYPNKALMLGLGTFLSLCFGLLLAVVIEKMDRSFRSAAQVEDILGRVCYALIPSAGRDGSRVEVARHILQKPSSVVSESVRTLRAVMSLRAVNVPPKVVAMTSSFSGEGKTVLSVWLARSAALAGEKVIVIDCDLRRPNLHSVLGAKPQASLVDYLTGQKSLVDIVHKDSETGMFMIYAHSVPNSALGLLASDKMRDLIASLRAEYDLVILDTPPCLAISDARVLSTLSDLTLYGIGWGQTAQEHVVQGVRQFNDIGTNLAMVLMNVDVARYVRYGYGDVVYYYADKKDTS